MSTAAGMMPATMEVVLHVYDVTNSGSEKTNNTILQINRIFKDRIGLGGIFHSAIQVYGDEEWSFGFCEYGSGVFSCPPGQNPMYTYRERIVLGETSSSIFKVNQILRELSHTWPGDSYDLLARNCNHFCDAFCERLGVPKLPGWVNRFANAADTTMEVAGNTAFRVRKCLADLEYFELDVLHRIRLQNFELSCECLTIFPAMLLFKLRQAKTEIVTASKVAYRFMAGLASNTQAAISQATAESPNNTARGSPRFQGAWFKNLMSIGAKPSTSTPESKLDDTDDIPLQMQKSSPERLQNNIPNSKQNI